MRTTKRSLKAVTEMLCPVLLAVFLFLAAISCKKNNATNTAVINLQSAAVSLEGEIINGSISTESDEEGMALWCNNGKILIGLEKIPSQEFTNPGTIEHAQVVYSSFGIILRDLDTGRFWYYIQNDKQSQQRFESLQLTSEHPLISNIAGTIKLHLS